MFVATSSSGSSKSSKKSPRSGSRLHMKLDCVSKERRKQKPKAKKQLILLSTLRVSSARKSYRKKLLRNASNLLRGPRPRTIWLRPTRLL